MTKKTLTVMLAVLAGVALSGSPATAQQPAELLPCEDRQDDLVLYLHRPRRCDVEAPSQSYGLVVNLRKLKWSNWGSAVATARGTEAGRGIKIRAWRLRKMCGDIDGNRAYTRLRTTSTRGIVTMRRPPCE